LALADLPFADLPFADLPVEVKKIKKKYKNAKPKPNNRYCMVVVT
jgi:hypothetical protein